MSARNILGNRKVTPPDRFDRRANGPNSPRFAGTKAREFFPARSQDGTRCGLGQDAPREAAIGHAADAGWKKR